MRLSIITPTCDQPLGMMLAERYVARQTLQPDEWIVADDGIVPARLEAGQTHIVRKRVYEGGQSLAGNMLAALERATGDVIVVIEHDDWYAPNHLELCAERLLKAQATGCGWQRYYNVHHKCHRLMKNRGSALCNTAFRRGLLPRMQEMAHKAFRERQIGLDRMFWDSLRPDICDIHDQHSVVGIKGLPGRPGLGLGHRPDDRWTADPRMETLRQWIGEDVENYR
jgi:glycosyltransferase involved in cell wall biosynthesis